MSTQRENINSIRCEEAIKRIFDYIDRELADAPRDEFQQHIELCRDCFDHTEFERLLKERIKNLKRSDTELLKKRVEELIGSF